MQSCTQNARLHSPVLGAKPDGGPSVFVGQHDGQHGLALVARARYQVQRGEPRALAAAVILETPGGQKWLARLSPEEQRKSAEGFPMFVWGLDAVTE